MRIRFRLSFGVLLAAMILTVPVSAHANLVRAEPGIGASVPTAPPTIRLFFSERPEPRYSDIAVYNPAHERLDKNDLRVAPDDPEALVISVRDLPQGTYTVVWKTVSALDGHNTGGSFAFAVGNAPIGATATQSTVTFSNPKPLEVVAKWLSYLSTSAFIGVLVFGMFIWSPALARLGRSDQASALADAANRRLARIAEIALLVLIAASVLGCLAQVGKSTDRSLLGVLRPAILRDFLFHTRTGSIWCLRLLLAFLAALVLGPLPLRVVRAPGTRETSMGMLGPLLGIALAANSLLAMSLLSHAAASERWTALSVALDWLHLLATAIWIGGLIGLAATISAIPLRTPVGHDALRAVVRRFSDVALVCVGTLALTGLYSAWLHVGSLGALWPTDYGRALLVKLTLVAGLVGLGAFNLLWLRPRLHRSRATDAVTAATGTHFLRSVGAEVVLGVLVLLVVGVLTGFAPSREAVAQTNGSPLAQRTKAGDVTAILTPSTLQPGPITYDLFLTHGEPIRDAEYVAFRFSSSDLGVDETEAVATSQGDGHYTATGPYTALDGKWQVRAIIRRAGKDDATPSFTLPIGAAPPASSTSTAPAVTPMVITYGIVAIIGVIAILTGATLLSRRLSRIRTRPSHIFPTPPAPTPIADRSAD
jgi:copper transport protein